MPAAPFILGFAIIGSAAAAAEPPARNETPASASSPIFVSKAPSQKTGSPSAKSPPAAVPARRAISPEMLARLNAIGRQRVPPPETYSSAASTATGESATTDAVQLDPFYVQDEKFPDWPERRMLDARGHLERHYKREPGLRMGARSLGNDIVAEERNAIELAHERGREMKELFDLARMAGARPPPAVKAKVNEAQSRILSDAPQSGGAFREKPR